MSKFIRPIDRQLTTAMHASEQTVRKHGPWPWYYYERILPERTAGSRHVCGWVVGSNSVCKAGKKTSRDNRSNLEKCCTDIRNSNQQMK